MSQPKLWINEIIDTLIDLGGEGSLEAINEQIAKRNVMNFYPNWPHTVRRTIEEHSSDTQSFHSKVAQIEVHHLRPISSLGGSVYINPQTDMTVLCSNCHRMIHRKHDDVLSLQELQAIIVHVRDKSDGNSTAIYTATPAKNHATRRYEIDKMGEFTHKKNISSTP
jgi:hypothetical protein